MLFFFFFYLFEVDGLTRTCSIDSFEHLTKIEKLEKAVERLEQELEHRNRELEEREAIIDELREHGARDSDREDNGKTDFEERMKLQVEGFQEQVF